METTPARADAQALWQRVRGELERALPRSTFELWIEPIRAARAQGDTLYLSAPGRVRAWVERRYLGAVQAALERAAPGVERVAFAEPEAERQARARSGDPVPLPIDPAHTFDGFVIGPGNRFAHAAALAVAELPGEAYNPLLLHGPPGLGKTHLLGAIAVYYRDHHPGLSFHFTTAERFTTEFVTALRTEGPERFKQRYRNLDALLIDDVQFLEGKPSTEEEFVHTFNALFAAGKQIVLSSDRPPSALERLEQRLRDRFEWGLAVAIEPPDLRTRVALLWRLAAEAAEGTLPDPETLREIAERVPGNVRRLEGAITRVLAVSSVFGEPLAPGAVRRALPAPSDTAPGGAVAAPSVAAIVEAVASVAGLQAGQILSGARSPRVARARQLAMYLARELTPLSLAQIAREFERDHSTVLHAVRAVEGRCEPDSEAAHELNRVRGELARVVDDASGGSPGAND